MDAQTDSLVKSFKRMMNEVVALGSCCGCSMCVVTCPYGVIKYDHDSMFPYVAKPKKGFDYCPISEQIGCDVCANACERLSHYRMRPISPEELDERAFGRRRGEDEYYGVTRFICAARSTDPGVVGRAQDGGVVTEILRTAFEEGLIEGACVAGPSDELWLKPVPKVVTSVDELLENAKSWYTYCATPLMLKEAVDKHKLSRVALVGVSCEVSGYAANLGAPDDFIDESRGSKNVGKQRRHFRQYAQAVKLSIGLFCTETFVFDGFLNEYLREQAGIDPSDVVKLNVKGKIVTDLKDGRRIETPLKEARVYQREQCNYCGDFSAEHADISAGGVGAEGWTVCIVRSERGEEVFRRALERGHIEVRSVAEFPVSMRVLKRLTHEQRERRIEQYRSVGGSVA